MSTHVRAGVTLYERRGTSQRAGGLAGRSQNRQSIRELTPPYRDNLRAQSSGSRWQIRASSVPGSWLNRRAIVRFWARIAGSSGSTRDRTPLPAATIHLKCQAGRHCNQRSNRYSAFIAKHLRKTRKQPEENAFPGLSGTLWYIRDKPISQHPKEKTGAG